MSIRNKLKRVTAYRKDIFLLYIGRKVHIHDRPAYILWKEKYIYI